MGYVRSRPGGLLLPRFLPWGDIEVDLSHPLAANLISAYIPGGPRGWNDFGPGGANLAPDTAATIKPSALGPAQLSTGNNQGAYLSTPTVQQVTFPASLFWMGEAKGSPAANANYIGMTSPTDAPPYIGVALGIDGGGLLSLQWNSGGSFIHLEQAGISPPTSGIFSIAGTWTPSAVALYRSGVSVAAGSGTYANPTWTTYTTGLGGQVAHKTDRNPNASTSAGYLWRRALSSSEIAWLHAEPFVFFRPRVRRSYSVISGGASIVPSVSTWGWAGGVPGFNVKTNVAGVTGTWAAAGNAATINQNTIIRPDTAAWMWFGRAVTSLGGSSLSGMVQGMVRGFVRLFVRGTNTGRP